MLSFIFKGSRDREQTGGDDPRFLKQRQMMAESQISSRGISDSRVLNAMRSVPRHLFVPEHLRDQAYDDGALPIGEGQTISQPYIVAIMTSLLALRGHERVLEVGSGSGYQTAILSILAGQVYSIEILEELYLRGKRLLASLGHENVTLRNGDGYWGWVEYAPFDGIIITAAPVQVPYILLDQLKVGGRLVVPVGEADQELMKVVKKEDGVHEEKVLPVRFVPMTGEVRKREG